MGTVSDHVASPGLTQGETRKITVEVTNRVNELAVEVADWFGSSTDHVLGAISAAVYRAGARMMMGTESPDCEACARRERDLERMMSKTGTGGCPGYPDGEV